MTYSVFIQKYSKISLLKEYLLFSKQKNRICALYRPCSQKKRKK